MPISATSTATRRASHSTTKSPQDGRCFCGSSRAWTEWSRTIGRRSCRAAIGFSSWLADREEPTRQGSRHRQNAPYQRMQTKDGYMMIGAAGEAIWQRCAEALGHPEWCTDPRFATNRQRMQNRAALEEVME